MGPLTGLIGISGAKHRSDMCAATLHCGEDDRGTLCPPSSLLLRTLPYSTHDAIVLCFTEIACVQVMTSFLSQVSTFNSFAQNPH